MTLMRKFLRESWVVLLPVLLSFLMTFYSIVEDDMFAIVCYFWYAFFLIMMICFRLTYKGFYQKIFGDFKWGKFIVFAFIFALLWFGFWMFVLRMFIA